MLTEQEQDVRRIRRGGRVAMAGAVAAVTAAAILGPLSTALAAPRAVAGPGSRAGWAAVPYRRAELSVPGSWLVESRSQLFCGPQFHGMIFAGIKPKFPKSADCRRTASLAWILPAGHIRPGHDERAQMINGIRVYRLPSAPGSVRYLVPGLSVLVGARGPQAHRVLATLARSPLSAVLRRDGRTAVPASWTWQRFGGVRFATPGRWTRQHENRWATCGTGQAAGSLLLIDATRPPLALPCAFQIPTAAGLQAYPGLTVVTGKYATRSVGETFGRCLVRGGARICLSADTGAGGLFGSALIFSVTSAQQHRAAYFVLGLPGSGRQARAIFDSVAPSRR